VKLCGCFPLIFVFYTPKVRHISTFGLFDLQITGVETTSIIITKFGDGKTTHCQVTAFLLPIRYIHAPDTLRNLVTVTFDYLVSSVLDVKEFDSVHYLYVTL